MNTTTKNLQPFWKVQRASGQYGHVFASHEAALAAYERWNAEVDEEFEKWQKGDSSADVMIYSTLESDLNGGCYHSYSVHPACRPSGIYHYPAFSQDAEKWKDNPGFDQVSWGNPATARPTTERY